MKRSMHTPAALLLAISAGLGARSARAEVPPTMAAEGTFYRADGTPEQGTLEVRFALYRTGTSTAVLWEETSRLTLDARGHYAVQLGAVRPFPRSLFESGAPLWVGLRVGAEDELRPRQALGTVPYAFHAASADTVVVGGQPLIDPDTGEWLGPSGPGQVGPVGPTGPTGPPGADGREGPVGPRGIDGPRGPTGATGPSGATGPAGSVGPVGPMGPVGADGVAGPAGAQGVAGPVGPQGPVGPVGPAGPQGALGPAGPQGALGPQGPAGVAGAAGAQGPLGPVGPQGPAGPQGAVGPAGPGGPAGPAGPQGAQGVAGPQGAQGVAGVAGPAGPSLLHVPLCWECGDVNNAAVAGTEIAGLLTRTTVDITRFEEVRLQFAVSTTNANVGVRVEFSTDNGTTWAALIAATTPATAVPNQHVRTAFAVVPEAARADVLLRAVCVGNANLDPTVRYVRIDLR